MIGGYNQVLVTIGAELEVAATPSPPLTHPSAIIQSSYMYTELPIHVSTLAMLGRKEGPAGGNRRQMPQLDFFSRQ